MVKIIRKKRLYEEGEQNAAPQQPAGQNQPVQNTAAQPTTNGTAQPAQSVQQPAQQQAVQQPANNA